MSVASTEGDGHTLRSGTSRSLLVRGTGFFLA